jgi:V8-like Glu-specific endopeptidase
MKRRRLSALFAAVFAVALAVPGLAGAQNDQPMSQAITLAAGAVEAYWTEERMRNAMPMPVPELATAQLARLQGGAGNASPTGPMVIANAGAPGDFPGEEVRQLTGLGTPEPLAGAYPFSYTRHRLFPDTLVQYKLFPYRLTGKLFFKIPGDPRDWHCSGSVVNASNLAVVWTAGHCVYSPGVGYHTNFAFSPARRLIPTGRCWAANSRTGWQPACRRRLPSGKCWASRF